MQGTSNVAAGRRYGIPVGGTMAHSWIQSFAREQEASDRFAEFYPERAILLVDTYDTLASGIPHAIPALTRLQEQGHGGFGVRLDSGDLGPLSRAVRARLDAAGLRRALLLAESMLAGERVTPRESLHAIRDRARGEPGKSAPGHASAGQPRALSGNSQPPADRNA